MLNTLTIRNFALIDTLDIDFMNGFSAITGETGAGKSIILGALSLLQGNRADVKQIAPNANKCIVEASFMLSDETLANLSTLFPDTDWTDNECILRREVNASGKSRAFVNDSPVTLADIKTIASQLIDIHSQHQNLLLTNPLFQLDVLDVIAHNKELLQQYAQVYKAYRQAHEKLLKAKKDIEEKTSNADYLRFQLTELNDARLSAGMQEDLEEKSRLLSHAEEIGQALSISVETLTNDNSGIILELSKTIKNLEGIANLLPLASEQNERLHEMYIELDDIASALSKAVETIEFNPQELERVNAQLDTIYTLQRKYHVDTVEQLIECRQAIAADLEIIDDSDFHLQQLQKEEQKCQQETIKIAQQLTSNRQKVAKDVEKEIENRLSTLGMPSAQVKFECNPSSMLTPTGADVVRILFTANQGMPLRPVSEIASGGEIARFMLILKSLIATASSLPTIVFDEIDTGVSGRVAESMALLMQKMASNENQVISITHLPQIAAVAQWHYKVEKNTTNERTNSTMYILDKQQRVNEIAQMLSGNTITKAALDNAKQLLEAHAFPL